MVSSRTHHYHNAFENQCLFQLNALKNYKPESFSESKTNSSTNATTDINAAMDTGTSRVGAHGGGDSSSSPIGKPAAGTSEINHKNGSRGNNGNGNKRANAKRRAMIRLRRSRRKVGTTSGNRCGAFRQRRLWQLPKSSIDEYTKWIQEKPEEEQTPNEQRFLWKCMVRSLGVVSNDNSNNGKWKGRQERIREFVERLEAKEPEELTEMEGQFVRLYHKRRIDRKGQRQRKQQHKQQEEDTQTVSWMRNAGSNNNNGNDGSSNNRKKNMNKNNNGFEPQASLESLRESMNKLGLSSDKLKQVRFADQQMMN